MSNDPSTKKAVVASIKVNPETVLKDMEPFDDRRADSLRRHVGITRGSRIRKWLWRVVALLCLAGAAAAVYFWQTSAKTEVGPRYETEAVRRGDLKATVSATGTLSGLDTVEVGAEISGTLETVNVDFNDRVTKGQVLCVIDPEQLEAARQQAQAKLASAQASLASAKATAKEAKLEAERNRALAEQGLVSDQTLQAALAAAERAESAVKASAADIELSRASLNSSRTALGKTEIRSPIDGVVLSRSVEPGQTVAASMTTPVLFVLAKDLTRMELTVGIDEADIGRVREGQPATFTVDAFPGREFAATLKSLHNLPTTTENVVTYEAVLTVTNDDLLLRPGMTATATIVTDQRDNVVLVPNAALRFSPPKRDAEGRGPRGMPFFGPPPGRRGGPRPQGSAEGPSETKGPAVWILQGRRPQRVAVTLGLSDGQHTEIVEGLEEGAQVIVDMLEAEGG